MARKGSLRLRRLVELVAQIHPQLEDPARVILARRIAVDGRIVDNPNSLVRPGAAVGFVHDRELRGEVKLASALTHFEVSVEGRVALDLGAAAGGFTRVLLRAGAERVYAVDAGFGQLLGSLRQDPRVVDLERTNLAALDRDAVPDEIELVTVDLSYLALGEAVVQLATRIRITSDADLVGLVKPQFELRKSAPPASPAELRAAVDAAAVRLEDAGWTLNGAIESPVRGSGGSVEFLLHAARAS